MSIVAAWFPAYASAHHTGTWKWTSTTESGQTFESAAILKRKGRSFVGVYVGEKGQETPITSPKLDGRQLSFEVASERDGQKVSVRYQGKIEGSTVKGTQEFRVGDETRTLPWEAKRMQRVRRETANTVPPHGSAADDIVGKWQFTWTRHDETVTNNVTFSKNAHGAIVGQWSDSRGESELSEIKTAHGKLTFVRSFRRGDGQEIRLTFTGGLEHNKLVGSFTTPGGDRQVSLTRIQPPASLIGQWDLTLKTPNRDVLVKLTFSAKPHASYSGLWASRRGENALTDIKYENGKLSFTRKSNYQGEERTSTFTGTVEGHKISGNLSSPRGEFTSTATRVGAALVGKWELTSAGMDGTPRTRILTIKDDLSAKYQFGRDREVDITDLKIDGDQVTFKMILSMGERKFPMEFKGKLAETTLNGEFITSRGAREVSGKRMQKAQ
jgi:hypothetical protein